MYITTNFLQANRSKNNQLDVKQLQALLNFLGESLIVDGDFGAKSTVAVKNFQKLQAIQVDGKVGEQTWLKFYDASLDHATELIKSEKNYDELVLDSENKSLVLWLQSILYLIDNVTETTAKFDEALESTILAFQASNECTEDGCVDFATWLELFKKAKEELERVHSSLLTDDYISKRATENDLSPAAVKAVVKVESNGRGFRRDGSLKILFEGHIFWKELMNVDLNPNDYVAGNEDIVFKSFTRRFYATSLQYGRLNKAKTINTEAALKSASYGMFQVMGFNYKTAGFDSVEALKKSLEVSEINQLEAFLNFVKNTNGCFEALQNKEWATFARIYNGSAYKTNKYDEKMEKQYNNSVLTKGIGEPMNEEKYTSIYALELEKAFSAFEG